MPNVCDQIESQFSCPTSIIDYITMNLVIFHFRPTGCILLFGRHFEALSARWASAIGTCNNCGIAMELRMAVSEWPFTFVTWLVSASHKHNHTVRHLNLNHYNKLMGHKDFGNEHAHLVHGNPNDLLTKVRPTCAIS